MLILKYFFLKEIERENIEQNILLSNSDVSIDELWTMDDRELVEFKKMKSESNAAVPI